MNTVTDWLLIVSELIWFDHWLSLGSLQKIFPRISAHCLVSLQLRRTLKTSYKEESKPYDIHGDISLRILRTYLGPASKQGW